MRKFYSDVYVARSSAEFDRVCVMFDDINIDYRTGPNSLNIEYCTKPIAAAPDLLLACQVAMDGLLGMRHECADPLAGEMGDMANALEQVIKEATV